MRQPIAQYNGSYKSVVSVYHGIMPDTIIVKRGVDIPPLFTTDQYTTFIQQEFIRLVESGAIPRARHN